MQNPSLSPRKWMRRFWQRALTRDIAYVLRHDESYRVCVALWRLPTREPGREGSA